MYVCMCVCVLDGEGNKVFASRAMYLTGFSDWLTSCCKPLSPLYKPFPQHVMEVCAVLQALGSLAIASSTMVANECSQ